MEYVHAVKQGVVAVAIGGSLLAAPASAALMTVYQDVQADVASLTPSVDAFRNALGPLNAPAPVNNTDGRREINWDGAPGAVADPNPFPGDFFNANVTPRARGLAMVPLNAGGFGISSDPADAGPGQPATPLFTLGPFGFQPFSPNRIFAVLGTNQFGVLFFNPANPAQPATVDGFGAVFVDVDDPGSSLEYYDSSFNLLATVPVPDQRFVTPQGSLSFAGATFTSSEVAAVVITAGASGLENCGNTSDCVAMDDFIYGEPQPIPVPAPLALLAGGIAGLGLLALRRRSA